jgi:hypothetical protein
VAVVAHGGCELLSKPALSLDPASVPVVEIGFEGQTDTFPKEASTLQAHCTA